jgi:hypothetical protein
MSKPYRPWWFENYDHPLRKLLSYVYVTEVFALIIGGVLGALLAHYCFGSPPAPRCCCDIAEPCLCAKGYCHCFETAAPDKPGPKEQPAIPDLAGETNWGLLRQNGSQLDISGCPSWSASGQINKDGTVSLLWHQLDDRQPTGRTAPSHYTIFPDRLEGRWAYSEDVTVNKDGTLEGPTLSDTIRWIGK